MEDHEKDGKAIRQPGREGVANERIDRDKCRRVAFILASIHTGAAKKIWAELFKVSHRDRLILYIFPGGRLKAPDSHESLRNGIFNFISQNNVDGAVSWASTLSGFVSEKEVEQFHYSVINVPLVTFGLKFENAPCVQIDAYSGMIKLISHLAEKHNKKKIAFIGGPNVHSSAEARYHAYRDALKNLGLTFDPRLAVLNNSWDEGQDAAIELLDNRELIPGKDFDALCAASDLLLFSAVQVFQGRGFAIPKDIAIGGFNDSEESYLLSPTFTTVNMPFARQASHAFKSIKQILSGHIMGKDVLLGTKLIIRQSCGCHIESVRLIEHAARKTRISKAASMKAATAFFHDELAHRLAAIFSSSMHVDTGKAEYMAKELIEASVALFYKEKNDEFLAVLDRMLNEAILEGKEISIFQDILTMFHSYFRKSMEYRGVLDEMPERVIHQARVLVSDAEKRMSNYQAWKERQIEHVLNSFNHDLLCAVDVASIVQSVRRWLNPIGIHACHLVMYYSEKESCYCGGYDKERALNPDSESGEHQSRYHFPANRILPDHLAPSLPGVHVVLPLVDRSASIGYAVMETEYIDPSLLEEVRAQLSSALRGVLLFREATSLRIRAEKAEKIKTELLARVSSELQKPAASIAEISMELMSQSEVCHESKTAQESLRKIHALALAQQQRVHTLLELSRAQAEDLPVHASFFSLKDLLSDFIESCSMEFSQAALDYAPLSSRMPVLFGDRQRVLQAARILVPALAVNFNAEKIGISCSILPSGVSIDIIASVSSVPDENKIAQIEAAVDREKWEKISAFSRSASGLELELAQRLMYFNHGKIEFFNHKSEIGFHLKLPYPAAMNRYFETEHEFTPQEIILVNGDPVFFSKSGFEDTCPQSRLEMEKLVSPIWKQNIPRLCYAELSSLTAGQAQSLLMLLESEPPGAWRFYFSCEDNSNHDFLNGFINGQYKDLHQFLEMKLRQGTALLMVARDTAPEDLNILKQALSDSGYAVHVCHDPETAPPLYEKCSPDLLISVGQNSSFLYELNTVFPAVSGVPTLCLAPLFSEQQFEKAIISRPNTCVLNLGDLFEPAIHAKIKELASNKNALGAAAGRLVMKSIFYINHNFRNHLSRWKLCGEVNASEDYLSRIFHQHIGIGLWDYLNRLRISYAITQLKTTNDTIYEIAERCGYQDQAYFCRVFRKLSGMAPTAIRKSAVSNVSKVQ